MCACDPSKPIALGQVQAQAARDVEHARGTFHREGISPLQMKIFHQEDPWYIQLQATSGIKVSLKEFCPHQESVPCPGAEAGRELSIETGLEVSSSGDLPNYST